MARRLAARGIGRGDRVATTLPPSLDFAVLLHALPKLGAVLVPLNTRLTAAEMRWQVEDSGAALLVKEPLSGDDAGSRAQLAEGEPLRGKEAEARAEPSVEDPPREEEYDEELPGPAGPDEPHTLIYTSGTTGRPKAVALTYRNHEASAAASAWNLGVAPDDRWLCVLPLFHVGGLAILLRSAIYGTAAVLHERFDSEAVASTLAAGEASLVSLVPTMLRRLLGAGFERAPALRAALVGGGPVPLDLLEWAAARKLPVVATYGMTETASQIATLAPEEAVRKRGTAGRPLPGVEVKTAGDGEILVRGPMVAPGSIADDGWLHTGDRGSLDEEGYLHVEGRLDDVIVTGGENVAAREVEEALLTHPAVSDAAAIGVSDAEWGEAITAFVVLSHPAQKDDLLAHCRERLAPFKVPKAIRPVDHLPRTATGKLLRREVGRR
jgi:o-succinylbenzoate---CoA ligase